MHDTLTSLQAYKAMLCFLENYYNKTLSDDLGSLLGDLQLSDDNEPFDPAAWHDWLKALGRQNSITRLGAFKAMINFLNAYYERTLSTDIKDLVDSIQSTNFEEESSVGWNEWMECIKVYLCNR
jgi:hypothetical protein